MEEVISNLVDNANRFIDQDGHIDIVLGGENGYATIDVLDDGSGFGDVDPRLLFERFYRTDSSRNSATGGHGIGLSMANAIVNAHGGKITAHTSTGHDFIVTTTLPLQ